MFERIIEIIVYVLSELRENKKLGDINFNELSKQGYTDTEISTAFSWLVDKVEITDNVTNVKINASDASFRILHEAEKELFTPVAWGELIQLQSLGLLNNYHIELIIERAILSGLTQIDAEQLKMFVAMMIFHAYSNNSNSNRFMLNGNEMVN